MRKFDGHVGGDGGQPLAHADALDVVLEALAIHLALDFGGAFERGFDGAELLDDRDGALVADAGSAGDVVDGVAFEREQVGHLRGRHAHELLHLGGVVPGVVLGGVEHGDVLVDELEHVLVAGDDDYVEALRLGAAGDGADDVVGLEAGVAQDGDAHGVEGCARMWGIWSRRSGGVSTRLALYSANSWVRWVGSPLSKTAAIYAGWCSLESLRSMLLKM